MLGSPLAHTEQLTALAQGLSLDAVRQEAVVTDAQETARNDVLQKAPDEFIGRNGRDLLAVAIPPVAVPKANLAVLAVQNTVI